MKEEVKEEVKLEIKAKEFGWVKVAKKLQKHGIKLVHTKFEEEQMTFTRRLGVIHEQGHFGPSQGTPEKKKPH